MKKQTRETKRILGRQLARETTREELEQALGGVCGCDPTKTVTTSMPPDEDPDYWP